jgi:hypothetical protein
MIGHVDPSGNVAITAASACGSRERERASESAWGVGPQAP